MDTPKNRAGEITMKIMFAIMGYIREDKPDRPNNYNHTYDIVYRILQEELEHIRITELNRTRK